MSGYHHLFGPVASRRYGQSLGVDLSLPKTCTLDCRFCQLGPTGCATVERADRPPMADVLDELRRWLAAGRPVDFITASGSGEPTLHSRFGDLFRFVRDETPYRSLLLSNGSLFFLPEVRRDAALADVVKVSLHAWDQASFERAVRPHPSLRFGAILDGYRLFRQEYAGRLDLEVFILPGLNDAPEQVRRIADIAASFRPDAVTLNTAVRPPADASVTACPPERLQALARFFGPSAQESGPVPAPAPRPLTDEALTGLVSRHPVALPVLARTFGLDEPAMRLRLQALAGRGELRLFDAQGTFFAGPPQPGPR
jgi:wyosine [tRNA(Phe)-imidazoG37] synthetase (radical SAM superfamily)